MAILYALPIGSALIAGGGDSRVSDLPRERIPRVRTAAMEADGLVARQLLALRAPLERSCRNRDSWSISVFPSCRPFQNRARGFWRAPVSRLRLLLLQESHTLAADYGAAALLDKSRLASDLIPAIVQVR